MRALAWFALCAATVTGSSTALTACAGTSHPAPSRANHASVHGSVYDVQTREALFGAVVIAISASGGTTSTITDENGAYQFQLLPDGVYEVAFYYADTTAVAAPTTVIRNTSTVVNMEFLQPPYDAQAAQATQARRASMLMGHVATGCYQKDVSVWLYEIGLVYRNGHTLSFAAMCFQGIGQCARP